MPAVRMFGRKWRVSSDFLPVFAGVGLVFHFFWVIFIVVWPFGITPVRECDNTKAGRQFLSSVALFFGPYVLSFIQELLILLIGLRGNVCAKQFSRCCSKMLTIKHILRHTIGDKQAQSYDSSALYTNFQLDWSSGSCM